MSQVNCPALSVRRPAANLILAGIKQVENRSWKPRTLPDRLVIHAGITWERELAALAARLGYRRFTQSRSCPGGFLGSVRLVNVHEARGCCRPWGLSENVFHWVLADPVLFPEPIAGPGRLSLFPAPAQVLQAVQASGR